MGLLKQWNLKNFRRQPKPPKPGLPKDAKPATPNSFIVGDSLEEKKSFLEKVNKIKLPDFPGIEFVVTWKPFRIKVVKNRLKAFMQSVELQRIIDKAETLTAEEIDAHEVNDWDYLVTGLDYEAFLAWVAKYMAAHLQKDGDVCMIPEHIFQPGQGHPDRLGLMNDKGVIKPFVASAGVHAPVPKSYVTTAMKTKTKKAKGDQ